MVSILCNHLKPHPRLMATRVKTWDLYSIRGLSWIYPAAFWKQSQQHGMQGWGQSASLSLQRHKGFYIYPVDLMGKHHLIPISVNGANHMNPLHINAYALVFWYLNAWNYISGEKLHPGKCSQFPLMLMEQRHTPSVLLRKAGKIWKTIRFGEYRKGLAEAAEIA